jgi:glycosyltransferase involved in cell wall biosynthesis
MEEQTKKGHTVGLLWPGQIKVLSKNTGIKQRQKVNGIESFEVINPVPISYDEGIQNIPYYIKSGNEEAYLSFLRSWNPDVIHVHTFMGMHKEFLDAAKKLSIRTVFTTHDFFPICPKVTMFKDNQNCPEVDSCNDCPRCNQTALSIKKSCILQHPLYRKMKDTKLVKRLRKNHRDSYLSNESIETENNESLPSNNSTDYKKLRSYYRTMMEEIDCVHYNSYLTRQIYEKYLGEFPSRTISISHSNIVDKKRIKVFGNKLRITYLGAQSAAKGYFCLKNALDKLWSKDKNFELNLFFQPVHEAPYMNIHPRYIYDQLEQIFNDTDLLVAPSLWFETFGFTVLEALSFGVPVLVSGNVGAKEVIPKGGGIIIEGMTEDKLLAALENLTKEQLTDINKTIVETFDVETVKSMEEKIETICYKK